MAHKIKSPRPRELEENETFSSFECWKGTLEYYLGLDDRFAEFLDETFTWKPKGVSPNRGLEDIKLENDVTITAAKRAKYLDIFLGQIACYATVISRETIVRDCRSMKEIFHKLRTHYGLSKSGSSILDVVGIKRKGNESAETLYQRILSLVDSTLLTPDSDLCHHGEPDIDECRTPTVENLVVCLWLKALHPSLPQLVKQRYATQLKDNTLASIREEISGCISELLAELGENDTPTNPLVYRANTYNRPNNQFRYRNPNYQQPRFPNSRYQNPRPTFQPRFQHNPSCALCQQAGRKEFGHPLSSCPFLPNADKPLFNNGRARAIDCPQTEEFYQDFTQSMNNGLPYNPYFDQQYEHYHNPINQISTQFPTSINEQPINIPPQPQNPPATVNRVATESSPYFHAYHNNHSIKITLDNGATVNLINEFTAMKMGLEIYPASQSATQADSTTHLQIVGETRLTLTRNGIPPLKFEGLVVRGLGSEVLGGVPFQSVNDIHPRTAKKEIWFGDNIKLNYGQ